VRQVLVRFACKPNAVVRKQAQRKGRSVSDGQSEAFVFMGYLCRAVGGKHDTVVTVMDMPVRLLGFRRGAFRGAAKARSGITSAGGRGVYAPPKAGAPAATSSRSAAYKSKRYFSRTYPPSALGQGWSFHGWPLITNTHGLHGADIAALSDTFEQGFYSDANLEGSTLARFELSILWALNNRFVTRLQDDWLQDSYGQGFTFATAYGAPERPQPMPSPFTPTHPVDATYYPRWNVFVPRQVSAPGICSVNVIGHNPERSVEAQVLVMPVAKMPAFVHVLYDTVDQFSAPARLWSPALPWLHRGAEPSLVVVALAKRAVIDEKPEDLDALGAGMTALTDQPAWIDPPADANPSAFMQIIGQGVIRANTWPEFLRPSAGNITRRETNPRSSALSASYVDFSGIKSLRPCVLGAAHSTEINGVVETLVNVRATDEYAQTITSAHRGGNTIETGESANVRITRTGLLQVTIDTSGLPIDTSYPAATLTATTHALFTDAVAPSTCPLFNGSTMNEVTAFVPHVIWAGVLAGKRCYAVRALRYSRSPFLAGLLQEYGDQDFTTNYSGYRLNSLPEIRAPLYFTDKGFGPYIDAAAPEELWWLIDGVRQVVTLNAGRRAAVRHHTESMVVAASSHGDYPAALWAHMDIFENDGGPKMLAREYAMEDYLPPVTALQQFAVISSVQVMYFLPHSNEAQGLALHVLNANNGDIEALPVVLTPWLFGTHYTQNANQYPVYGLTCYQHEVRNTDGEILTRACLLLAVSSGDKGYALLSTDGGHTWQPHIDAPSSFTYQGSNPDISPVVKNPGISGLGYHFAGTALWHPEPGHPFKSEVAP
jgi:hypothetical protein